MAYFIDSIEVTKEEYEARLPEIQARAEKVRGYVQKVQDEVITMNDVPAEYYDEVYSIVNTPEPEEPEPTYTLDEAAAIIANEVAGNE